MASSLAVGLPGPLRRDEAAAFLAGLGDLRRANEAAESYGWGGRWESSLLETLADPDDAHVVVPILRNGRGAGEPPSCRCYVWLKLRGKNARRLTMLDVPVDDLERMGRPSEMGLAYLLTVILGELPIENLASLS